MPGERGKTLARRRVPHPLWQRLDLRALLERHGTAGRSFRFPGQPEQAWLPALRPRAVGEPRRSQRTTHRSERTEILNAKF